jgi:hypothetical protein
MDLHAALESLQDELPGLMGKINWKNLPSSFQDAVNRLGRSRDLKEQEDAALGVRQVLAAYPSARIAVDDRATELGALRQSILPILRGSLGDENSADYYATSILHGVVSPAPVEQPVEVRGVTVAPHGLWATTVKLRNFLVHPGKVAEFIGHSALCTLHGLPHPNPVLIGLGLVLLANCAREAATIHIPEHDATVFWGLIQAQKKSGNEASAPESEVLALTNAERNQAKLGTLQPEDITRALDRLADLKCVEKIAGNPTRWRIIEKYKIKVESHSA